MMGFGLGINRRGFILHGYYFSTMECQECHVGLSNRWNLKRHVLNIYQMVEPYQMDESVIYERIDCPHCYAVLSNALRLRQHVDTYHPVVIEMVACIHNACK